MKKVLGLFLTLVIGFILVGCTTSTKSDPEPLVYDFADYDFTDLIACMGDMLDNDDNTVCAQEDADQYMLDYANHYVQYLDENVEVTGELHNNDVITVNGALFVMIGYTNLPNSFGEDSIALLNAIVEDIHFNINSIVINDIGLIAPIKPAVQFSGQLVSGLFDGIDIPAFQYIGRAGTEEIYMFELRYYGDFVLTDNFDSYLDKLDTLKEQNRGQHFRVYRSNGTEYVFVKVIPFESKFDLMVGGEGMGTTDLTNADFLSTVESHYPEYTELTEN